MESSASNETARSPMLLAASVQARASRGVAR